MPKMIPVNMSVEGVHAVAGLSLDHQMLAPPSVAELGDWTQENYNVDVSVAANLGFQSGTSLAAFSTTR